MFFLVTVVVYKATASLHPNREGNERVEQGRKEGGKEARREGGREESRKEEKTRTMIDADLL